MRPADRWLALAVLILPCAFLYAFLIHPFWLAPMQVHRQQMKELRQRELRLQSELAQSDAVAEQFFQIHQKLAGTPGFLAEGSSEQAAAALLQRVEQVVGDVSPGNRSCLVTARTPLPANDTAPQSFKQVSVQVRLRCGAPELARLLHQLETGSPRLFVDNLVLIGQRHQVLPGESGAGIDAAFDVYGFLDPSVATPSVQEISHVE